MEFFSVLPYLLSQGSLVGTALCADLEGMSEEKVFTGSLFGCFSKMSGIGQRWQPAACVQVLRDFNLRYCKHPSVSVLP